MTELKKFKPESIDFATQHKGYNYVILLEENPVTKTTIYFWYIQLKEDLSKLLMSGDELEIEGCNIHHALRDCDRDLVWIGFDSERVYYLKEEEKFSLDYFKKVIEQIIDNIVNGNYQITSKENG